MSQNNKKRIRQQQRKDILAGIFLLVMSLIGLAIPAGIIMLLVPDALPYIIGFYVVAAVIAVIAMYFNDMSMGAVIFVGPMLLGCFTFIFFAMLFAWVPSIVNAFYMATLKRAFRWREKQPIRTITTQEQLNKLASGYKFRFQGMVDKNDKGRKGKIIMQKDWIYLGDELGWVNLMNHLTFLPQNLSVDTGDDIIEFQLSRFGMRNTTPRGRFGGKKGSRFQSQSPILSIPDRPDLGADVALGTRMQWEFLVGDELVVEGQVLLQQRQWSEKNRMTGKRINYERLEIVNLPEWQVYEPDEESIKLAITKREQNLYLQNEKNPVQTVESIADFKALDPGQRFVIRGTVDESNDIIWKDYVFYRPKFQFSHRWYKSTSRHQVINIGTLHIQFPDGVYGFNLTTPFYLLLISSIQPVGADFADAKIKFSSTDKPEITENLQNGSRAYHVLKVGDVVWVHARRIPIGVSDKLALEAPAFAVTKVVVDSQRGWALSGKDELSPAEEAWQKQLEHNTANKVVNRFGKLPPSKSRFGSGSSRFGQSSGSGRFGSGKSRFGQSSSESPFGKRDNTGDNNDNSEKQSPDDSDTKKDDSDT